jgi:hypothetical protein
MAHAQRKGSAVLRRQPETNHSEQLPTRLAQQQPHANDVQRLLLLHLKFQAGNKPSPKLRAVRSSGARVSDRFP